MGDAVDEGERGLLRLALAHTVIVGVNVLIVDAVAQDDAVKNTVPESVKVNDAVAEGAVDRVTAGDRDTVTVTDTRLVLVELADTLEDVECVVVFDDEAVTEEDGDVENECGSVFEIRGDNEPDDVPQVDTLSDGEAVVDFENSGVLESIIDGEGEGEPVLETTRLVVLIGVEDTEGLGECVNVVIGEGEPDVELVDEADGKIEVVAVSQADKERDIVADDVTHDEYILEGVTVPDAEKLFAAVADATPVRV